MREVGIGKCVNVVDVREQRAGVRRYAARLYARRSPCASRLKYQKSKLCPSKSLGPRVAKHHGRIRGRDRPAGMPSRAVAPRHHVSRWHHWPPRRGKRGLSEAEKLLMMS